MVGKRPSMLNQKLLQDPEVQKIIKQAFAEYDGLDDAESERACYDFIKENTKPPVILKTQDGVEVTDGNTTIYCANFHVWESNTYSAGFVAENGNANIVKSFSTPESRDEYILWNKPLLSGEDVKKYVQLISDNDKNRLTALLKSKIK